MGLELIAAGVTVYPATDISPRSRLKLRTFTLFYRILCPCLTFY